MTDWPNPDEWNLAPLDHTISGKFLLDDCDLCVRIRDLEAQRDEFIKVRDDFTRRGFHRCGSNTTLCYCAHMDEDLVSERNALKEEVERLKRILASEPALPDGSRDHDCECEADGCGCCVECV